MKRPYLVGYDYGQGGLWAYLLADSEEEIHARYPELIVHDLPPPWMSPDTLRVIEEKMTFDIDDESSLFLQAVLDGRES